MVRGVGDYGNCIGVPTLGGEVGFADGYSGNPLVNAMCVGILREADLATARAHGVGNVLLNVGAKTGRDGIHGASFASEELSEKSEARRPQVQVGDPFTEKLLLEASLELITSKLIVAIQDMGAAGLTSSSAEMAARGGVGVEIDTGLVPTREAGMTPYEILLSESQERMLVVAEPRQVPAIQAICRKWELDATPIGQVTDDGLFRVRHNGLTVAEIPGQPLVDDCPIYTPEAREAPAAAARRKARPRGPARVDADAALEALLDTPSIASKRWVYEQYDSTVQASTVLGPGGDAGVFRVDGESFALAVSVDCNNRLVALDPYEGGKATVAEAARNVACTGAEPLGITDCLNFGNPEKPEVFFQFKEACRGISDACVAFGTPVTGGNVSFYNESPTGAVDPTPTVGMVGLLRRAEDRVPSHFRATGDRIVIVGGTDGRARRVRLLGGALRLRRRRGAEGGPRARGAAPALPGGGGRGSPPPVRPRLLRGRPGGGARRGGHRRAIRRAGLRGHRGSPHLRPGPHRRPGVVRRGPRPGRPERGASGAAGPQGAARAARPARVPGGRGPRPRRQPGRRAAWQCPSVAGRPAPFRVRRRDPAPDARGRQRPSGGLAHVRNHRSVRRP